MMVRKALLSLACVVMSAAPVWAGEVGVLVLAHGGSAQWNQLVQDTVTEAHLSHPTAIAFGMGMEPREVQQLQEAVDQLEQQHVERIIAIPLLVSSSSEVARQLQYLLGLRAHGPWEQHARPVVLHVPVVMTSPLDDHPLVADILLERAQALSRVPAEENVILIAHGPNEDADNAAWLQMMGHLGERIQQQGHFRAVIPVTMRDDAPPAVRDAVTSQIRDVIQQYSQHGRALVVPLLIASGGIETKIPERLAGLSYAYQGTALLPHPKIAA